MRESSVQCGYMVRETSIALCLCSSTSTIVCICSPAGNTEDLAPAVETEQDALIGKREYTVKNLRTLMPYCSRAYHAGFVGYNRESSKSKSRDDSHLQGETLSQRVATLMTMNQDEMNADTPIKDIVQVITGSF